VARSTRDRVAFGTPPNFASSRPIKQVGFALPLRIDEAALVEKLGKLALFGAAHEIGIGGDAFQGFGCRGHDWILLCERVPRFIGASCEESGPQLYHALHG
jgi:hypothetical protein